MGNVLSFYITNDIKTKKYMTFLGGYILDVGRISYFMLVNSRLSVAMCWAFLQMIEIVLVYHKQW